MNKKKVINGVKKVRRSYAKRNNLEEAVEAMEEDGRRSVKALISAYDGSTKSLLKKLKKMSGATTEEKVQSALDLDFGEVEVQEDSEPESDELDAVEMESDGDVDEVEVELVEPYSMGCPPQTPDGRPVHVVTSDIGLYGCAAESKPQSQK